MLDGVGEGRWRDELTKWPEIYDYEYLMKINL